MTAKKKKMYGNMAWTSGKRRPFFFDPLAQQFADDHPSQERFILIGQSARPQLLLVVFAEKDDEEIRIISARRPTAKERQKYEEGI